MRWSAPGLGIDRCRYEFHMSFPVTLQVEQTFPKDRSVDSEPGICALTFNIIHFIYIYIYILLYYL
jgi:hypothetical protein